MKSTQDHRGPVLALSALTALGVGLVTAWAVDRTPDAAPEPSSSSASRVPTASYPGRLAAGAEERSVEPPEEIPPHPYFPGLALPLPDRFDISDAAERRPHPVILITIDTLRADHVSGYGHDRDTTPELDRLARDGVTFTNAYSSSTWTRPSVASIFTSRWPSEHGAGWTTTTLRTDLPTVAERFREGGFTTAGFTGNRMTRTTARFERGFDEFREVEAPYPVQPDAEVLLGDALEWIESHREGDAERPFFVWLFLVDPHDPYEAPDPWPDTWSSVDADAPRRPDREYRENLPEDVREKLRTLYDGEISYMDQQLGLFFDKLAEMGVLQEATVAVVADHGEAFGEHGCYLHAFHTWDAVTRVPLIVRSPVLRSDLGARSDVLVSVVDVAPTLLSAAGLDPMPDARGVDLWATLADPDRARDYILAEVDAYGVRRAFVRDERHKLVYHHEVDTGTFGRYLGATLNYPTLALDDTRIDVYDLLEDPYELDATSGAESPEAARLYRYLSDTLPLMAPASELAGLNHPRSGSLASTR